MTRTSNVGDAARRIRDTYSIPLTAGKSIARALAARGWLQSSWTAPLIERAAAVARDQGGKLTLEQAVEAMTIIVDDGTVADFSRSPGYAEFTANVSRRMSLRLRPSAERIAAQWVANRESDPVLKLGQFQAPVGEQLVLTGAAGTGKSYALTNMLLTLCSEHGPDQVQLLIGEAWAPAIGQHCAALPHTIRAFDRMEDDQEPFLRKLRYELAKRRKLWRLHRDQGDDRYKKMPTLLVVLDGFADNYGALRKDTLRVLDRISGYWDDTTVLMTQHQEWARPLRSAPWHWLHFGGNRSWSDQTLRELLGAPKPWCFTRGPDGGHVAIHTARAHDVFPSTTAPAVSRVVDSPRFDDDFVSAMAAAIQAAAAVQDPNLVTPPATRLVSPDPEEYGEDRVPRGTRIHDTFFPSLAVRTIIATANDPETAIGEMDLPDLLPEFGTGEDSLVVVWMTEREYGPGRKESVWVRAHAAGGIDALAVENAVMKHGHPDARRESALWEELRAQTISRATPRPARDR